MPHSLYVTLLYILSYRSINFKLAFKFSTDHALPTAEAAHSQDLRSPGMSLHLYVRPPSIPGKHQSCDWPSKLPHPSPSWTRQWIQYVPRKGARSWIRWHIRKQPVPEQAAAANSQPVTIPRSLEKDGLKFEAEGWLVHHSILFTEQTAK